MIAIAAPTDVIELSECLSQCSFGGRKCVLGVVLTLGLKASFVLEELLPVEISSGDRNMWPWLGLDTHRAD
jgi:hypothetical protein